MAEPVISAKLGKDKVLMFRVLTAAARPEAARLALQTEHSWNYSRTTDLTPTKDGAVASTGGLEVGLDIAAVSSDDAVNTTLFNAVKAGQKLEVWEVDLASSRKAVAGDVQPGIELNDIIYDAKYAQGYLESWAIPSTADGIEEFSTTMNIDHKPVKGVTKLSATQIVELETAFAFKAITANS